jgi:hypothetical protein
MSTLDEITKEKQRFGEALARVDAQREKLVSELNELEATERVLARYAKGRSTYFLDTDVVITADKALLDILKECRPYAPCRLPDGKLIPAGAAGVADLLRMLEA